MRYVALVHAAGEQDVGQGADREHRHVLAPVRRPGTGNSRSLQPKTNIRTYVWKGCIVERTTRGKFRSFVITIDRASPNEDHRDVFHAPRRDSPPLTRSALFTTPVQRGEREEQEERKEKLVGEMVLGSKRSTNPASNPRDRGEKGEHPGA